MRANEEPVTDAEEQDADDFVNESLMDCYNC